jgi:ABC-type branched-subunit amino acid transport system substrate-binding protein
VQTGRKQSKGAARRSVRRVVLGLGALSVLTASTVALIGASGPAGASSSKSSSACQTPGTLSVAAANSTTGITSNSVTVGNVSIISGPIPGLFEGAAVGVKAYFNYLNAQGGVNGRKLNVVSYDDAFSGQQNAAETQQAVNSDFALVGDFSLFDNYGCKILAATPAMPDVSVTLDPGTNALSNDYSAYPLAQGAPLGPIEYFKSHFPKDLKVGTIISNVQSAVYQWNGRAAAFKHAGYKIAYVRRVGPLESNFTTDVINMRNAGVNVVDLTALDWQVAAILIQNMVQQNFRPALIESGGPIYSDQFIKTAGGAAATNGLYVGQSQALYLGQDAKTTPVVKTFLDWVKLTNPSWTPDLYTLFGWASAQLFAQALQAAGKSPTRGKVLTALSKITSFNAGGLLAPSNPAKKLPASCYVMAKIINGNFVRLQPKGTGFTCNAPYFG